MRKPNYNFYFAIWSIPHVNIPDICFLSVWILPSRNRIRYGDVSFSFVMGTRNVHLPSPERRVRVFLRTPTVCTKLSSLATSPFVRHIVRKRFASEKRWSDQWSISVTFHWRPIEGLWRRPVNGIGFFSTALGWWFDRCVCFLNKFLGESH